MTLHRRNPRRDQNEPNIVNAFKAMGFQVTRISGAGVPDLLLARGGSQWLVEVKTQKGRFKPAQAKFHAEWQGSPIAVIRSVEDAIRWASVLQHGMA